MTKDDVGFLWSSELLLLPLFKLRLNEGMMRVMQKGFRYQTETELTHPKVLFVSKMLWLDQWNCLLTHSWRFGPHEQKRVVHLLEGQGGTAPCYSDCKSECEEPVWEHTGRCTFEIIHSFAHLSNKCLWYVRDNPSTEQGSGNVRLTKAQIKGAHCIVRKDDHSTYIFWVPSFLSVTALGAGVVSVHQCKRYIKKNPCPCGI